MLDQYFAEALDKIAEADINPSVYRTAVRLLRLAADNNGYLDISHADALDACGTTVKSTMRAHLITLRDAGVLARYCTNGTVRVKFAAYPGDELVINPRQTRDHQSRTRDPQSQTRDPGSRPRDHQSRTRDPQSQTRDPGSRGRDHQSRTPEVAKSGADALVLGSWLVGSDLEDQPDQQDQEPTNQVQPSQTESERSFRLLTDPDLMRGIHQPDRHIAKVRLYALNHQFLWLIQQVGAYWRDFQSGKVKGIGALHNRIEKQFRLEPFDPGFLESPLYHRHYPLDPDETRAWQQWRSFGEYAHLVQGLTDPTEEWPPDLVALVEQLPPPVYREAVEP